jgi:hypothetical protein
LKPARRQVKAVFSATSVLASAGETRRTARGAGMKVLFTNCAVMGCEALP